MGSWTYTVVLNEGKKVKFIVAFFDIHQRKSIDTCQISLKTSVVEPHHFYAAPAPTITLQYSTLNF
jgi:hypothetical protein